MSRQVLAILIIFFKHKLSLSMYLRWLYESLFRLGVDKLLHLSIILVNSFLENGVQEEGGTKSNLLKTFSSM